MSPSNSKAKAARAQRREKAAPQLSPEPDAAPPEPPSIPVVAIGASAGALDAFTQFFEAMPADSGLAFVLIQHLDPVHESHTAELLASHTAMPVTAVQAPMRLAANQVYVIPAGKYLTIQAGELQLTEPVLSRGLRMPIDYFFRALADDQQEKAIGIILSGTGNDGTLGLKAIKGVGGLVLAQSPETADYDGMPQSAIATTLVDYVCLVNAMPELLLKYIAHAYHQGADQPPVLDGEAVDQLHAILAVLRSRTQYDFRPYKKGTLIRRIERRMSLNHLETLLDYQNLLRQDASEAQLLFKDLLIGVTGFFRDPEAFQALQEQILPTLLQSRTPGAPLRVWVPACATGEEAYSIAMLLIEQLQALSQDRTLQIFATDLDEQALAVARAGIFPESIATEVSPERLQRFFVKTDPGYQVIPAVRDSITFATQNLLADPPFSNLALISCRNLLIYLEPMMQSRVISLFHFALNPGGYLFLGNAESLSQQAALFEPMVKKWRLYRRLDTLMKAPDLPTPYHRAEADKRSTRPPPAQPDPTQLKALTEQRLLQYYAPAAVLINRKYQILYFHGPIDDYLRQPPGAPTNDLLSRVREALCSELRIALHKAHQDNGQATVSKTHLRDEKAHRRVIITVTPISGGPPSEEWLLVSFEDQLEPMPTGAARSDTAGAEGLLLQQLEAELKVTKEDLRTTIVEHETAAEELKLANEEVMSVNEELQSANEELETSKEELQSLNEELTTLNSQLQAKLDELEATSNDLANLLSSTDIPTLFLDPQLRIKRFTPATTRLFKLIATDIDRPLSDIVAKVNDSQLLADTEAVLAHLIPREQELCTDDDRWYLRRALPYRTQDNRINGVVVTFIDITERRHAEIIVQQARLYAESIVETVREPLLILDESCRVMAANAAFYKIFRGVPKETEQVLLSELGDGQWNLPELCQRLEEVVRTGGEFHNYEIEHDFPIIGHKIMMLNARAIEQPPDRPKRILLAIEDVSEARQLSVQLSYDARHDALTGLANRREFERRLSKVLANTKNTHSENALIYLDLDQFKLINDSCGHAAGDELLRQLGAVLYEHIRSRDMLARLGGDEFGVLLEHCSLVQAQQVGETLRKTVEAFIFVWEQRVFKIGVSLGLVAITADALSIDTIMKAADAACYAAKDSGRNRLHVYRESDTVLAERHGEMQWVARLDRALEEDRLRLYSQAIVPINGASDGLYYELLTRLEDEDGELVLPGAFLPAAERYGLATKLDRWVFQAALKWLIAHPEHVERLSFCGINLSGHSVVDKSFLVFVLEQLQGNELLAHKIGFEITETAAITSLVHATQFIEALKEQGCRFALDDFGSGFISFSHLKTLPVDFLKIDGAFVKNLVDDPVNWAIIQGINQVAQAMGKQTIAECVENDVILAELRVLGVDYAQGYAIGHPQPLDAMT